MGIGTDTMSPRWTQMNADEHLVFIRVHLRLSAAQSSFLAFSARPRRRRGGAAAGRGALSSWKRNYHENDLDWRRGAYCGGGSGFRRNQGWAHGIGHHRDRKSTRL